MCLFKGNTTLIFHEIALFHVHILSTSASQEKKKKVGGSGDGRVFDLRPSSSVYNSDRAKRRRWGKKEVCSSEVAVKSQTAFLHIYLLINKCIDIFKKDFKF